MTQKVYFNSACPVCRSGIAKQRERMSAAGVDDVQWIDVHVDGDAVCALNTDLESVRERLHVVDDRGQVFVGAAAFAQLGARTAGQRWWAWILRLPVLRTLARWGYNVFARGLYRWNRRKGRW
jgi:predicted DCC family thiol-disulfide oxidoreductase YuxK